MLFFSNHVDFTFPIFDETKLPITGAYVCIDKVALSCGELYTVLINKAAHGGKGSIIGIIKGTDVCTVTSVLLKLSRRRRY